MEGAMNEKHGIKIVWTSIFGWQSSVFSADHDTLTEAWEAALSLAIFHGWTPPQRWQFWRRNDSRPPAIIDLSAIAPPTFVPDLHGRYHYSGKR
jgi:hypothetical protein